MEIMKMKYYFIIIIKKIKKVSIIINSKRILKLEKYSYLTNINKENNFYKTYQKKISKYISLLNFDENKPEVLSKKKYMNIQAIKEFFFNANIY